ncbi:hypothetical protein SDC9_181688 [bioreactor metagenome]|uniref:Uncharacterized protein n=1 Tax=bioreactor metagenome TaxID=1076179 RepID=A0A645H5B8_9ZZZZ
MLTTGLADLPQDHIHLLDVVDHAVYQAVSLLNQLHPFLGLTGGILNQMADLAGRRCALLRQLAYFPCHHGKPTAMLTGSRGFNSRIKRQNIGLECNGVNQVDDVRHAVRCFIDHPHFLRHLIHHLAIVLHNGRRPRRELRRFSGMFGRVFYRGGDLLH